MVAGDVPLGMVYATLEYLGVASSAAGIAKLAEIRALPNMEDLLTSDNVPCSECGIGLCLYAYKVNLACHVKCCKCTHHKKKGVAGT